MSGAREPRDLLGGTVWDLRKPTANKECAGKRDGATDLSV